MGPRLTKFTERERVREGVDRAQSDPGTCALGLKAASVAPEECRMDRSPWFLCSGWAALPGGGRCQQPPRQAGLELWD